MTIHHCIDRADLYRLVWSEPLTKLAERYGLSDVGLRKVCVRYDIPLPPQGYRQQVAAGRAPKPIPLPKSKAGTMVEFTSPSPPLIRQPADDAFAPLIEHEGRPENRIVVTAEPDDIHPVARRVLKALKAARPDKYGAVVYEGQDPFRVRVPPGSIDRAVNLIDAFVKALAVRRIEVRMHGDGSGGAGIMIADEPGRITIEEASQRQAHKSTDAEKARTRRYGYSTAPMYDFVPSGVMTIQISSAKYRDGVRSLWKDGRTRKIEACLNELMIGLYLAARSATEAKRKAAIREQRAEEENARRAALRLDRATAQRQLDDLEARSLAWDKAQRMRAFIAAFEVSRRQPTGVLSEEESLWVTECSRHADRLDPLTPTPVSPLDYEDRELAPISPWQIKDD
ncbi:MAG: hypothetical protein Q8M32_12440 [Brevundimonas sp.]|nr:hypothetical protein [Brevundimonas sp.]